MNQNLFETKWQALRGQLKAWWGELTDEELDRIAGNFDYLMSLLQTHYGYTRKRSEEEFNRRMALWREYRTQRIDAEFKLRLAKHTFNPRREAERSVRLLKHKRNGLTQGSGANAGAQHYPERQHKLG